MDTVMVQFRHRGPEPDLAEVCRVFGLRPDEVDRRFGVVPTDPDEGLYTVLIAATVAERVAAVLAGRPPDPAEGIFSNPPIEPFGPPES